MQVLGLSPLNIPQKVKKITTLNCDLSPSWYSDIETSVRSRQLSVFSFRPYYQNKSEAYVVAGSTTPLQSLSLISFTSLNGYSWKTYALTLPIAGSTYIGVQSPTGLTTQKLNPITVL